MTPCADLLDEIQLEPIYTVTSVTGAKAKVIGMGCAKFMGLDGELMGLKNVLWVPDLCANLIYTGRLGDAGVNTETIGSERYRAYNDKCLIWDLQRKGDVHKRMWQIPVLPRWKSGKAAAAESMEESVTKEEQQGVQGDELIGGSAAVKASATSGQADWETWYRQLAHGTGGVLYFLTMVDEWSHFTWARPLSKKSNAAVAIKEDWLPMVERQAMRLVKVLRSDHGGEFLGVEFTKFLKRNSIQHQLTCPGTSQQNGIAERANRTIGKAAKTLLGAAGMPYKFWPEAVRHVITVKNRVLTHVGDKHWVPYERWLGKKPSIDMLLVWGCMGLVMVHKEQRHKLEVAAVWADWQQQQQQQIGLRLQEMERSAVEEVQLRLADLHGSEVTSDHSGGGEQQVSGPAAEEGLEDDSTSMDSPSQPEPAATAKATKRSVQKGASPHGQQTPTCEKRVAAPHSRLKYSRLGGPKQGAMAVQADEEDDEEMAFCFFTPLPREPATLEEALSGPQKEG
ncbi:unnamed protein product [Closterium sp. NIES-54]